MGFRGITNGQWRFIRRLLPPPASTGRPRANDRKTIDAIVYVLRTGIPWNELPPKYGDEVTAWRRLKRWEKQGVWKRVMDALIARGYSTGKLNPDSVAIDSSTVPAKKGES